MKKETWEKLKELQRAPRNVPFDWVKMHRKPNRHDRRAAAKGK